MLTAVKRRAVEYFIVFHRWLAIAIGVCNFPKCPVTTGKFNFSANALLYYWMIVENECFALLPVAFARE